MNGLVNGEAFYLAIGNTYLFYRSIHVLNFAEINNCVILLNRHGLVQYEGEAFQKPIPETDYQPEELEKSRLVREYVKEFSDSKGDVSPAWFADARKESPLFDATVKP